MYVSPLAHKGAIILTLKTVDQVGHSKTDSVPPLVKCN